MSIAKIFYLGSPEPGRYVLNFQLFGSEELVPIEVAPEQLRNVLIDGITLMLRQSFHRVPVNSSQESADGSAGAGAQRTA